MSNRVRKYEDLWADNARDLLEFDRQWDRVGGERRLVEGRIFETPWFEGGTLNVCVNCVDRHLPTRGDQVAIIGVELNDCRNESGGTTRRELVARKITYRDLHERVCRLANVLRSRGIRAGDEVLIQLPPQPERAIAILACARIGAWIRIHDGCLDVVGLLRRCVAAIVAPDHWWFSESDCEWEGLHTVIRVHKDAASSEHAAAAGRTIRDIWYEEACSLASPVCEPLSVDSNWPLFIHEDTDGEFRPTGGYAFKFASAGYLLQAGATFRELFDPKSGTVHWCLVQRGLMSCANVLLGPLVCGSTTVVAEAEGQWIPGIAEKLRVTSLHVGGESALECALLATNDTSLTDALESVRTIILLDSDQWSFAPNPEYKPPLVRRPYTAAIWDILDRRLAKSLFKVGDSWIEQCSGLVLFASSRAEPDGRRSLIPMFGLQVKVEALNPEEEFHHPDVVRPDFPKRLVIDGKWPACPSSLMGWDPDGLPDIYVTSAAVAKRGESQSWIFVDQFCLHGSEYSWWIMQLISRFAQQEVLQAIDPDGQEFAEFHTELWDAVAASLVLVWKSNGALLDTHDADVCRNIGNAIFTAVINDTLTDLTYLVACRLVPVIAEGEWGKYQAPNACDFRLASEGRIAVAAKLAAELRRLAIFLQRCGGFIEQGWQNRLAEFMRQEGGWYVRLAWKVDCEFEPLAIDHTGPQGCVCEFARSERGGGVEYIESVTDSAGANLALITDAVEKCLRAFLSTDVLVGGTSGYGATVVCWFDPAGCVWMEFGRFEEGELSLLRVAGAHGGSEFLAEFDMGEYELVPDHLDLKWAKNTGVIDEWLSTCPEVLAANFGSERLVRPSGWKSGDFPFDAYPEGWSAAGLEFPPGAHRQ